MNKSVLFFSLLIISSISFSSCVCYSFKGISIPPDINTFYVENFKNKTVTAPVDIEVRFSEALRSKIRNESRLKFQEAEPDILFEGDVVGYNISAEAPQEGNTVALNKLDIVVSVKYTNKTNEKLNYTRNFSFFQTYPGDQDLTNVQDDLIKRIFDQIVERIFNDTFTTW
ncbi:MAG: LptE family protein [Saprospiraceae bacterium]